MSMTKNIQNIVKDLVNRLSNQELTELAVSIAEYVEVVGAELSTDEIADKRFAEGLVCPHCNKKHIVKNGKTRGIQRYLCRDCTKTFNALTKTVFANTKLSISTWIRYADCMCKQMTLRETAKVLGISLKTSFFMRHKILKALAEHMGLDLLKGVLEMDETFFAESFKGNHKKGNPYWVAPRNSGKSHKRGKEIDYRGISHEQTCVSTAIDRNGGLVVVPICMGRLTTKALNSTYQDNIEQSSTICTDSHRAYIQFAKNVNAEHIQIDSGKHKKGIYHINHINALHNKLKLWMKPKYGVATKYLANYMYWFNWEEKTQGVSRYNKSKDLIYNSFSSIMKLTRIDITELTPFISKEDLV